MIGNIILIALNVAPPILFGIAAGASIYQIVTHKKEPTA